MDSFARFQAAYPAARRKGGDYARELFERAVGKVTEPALFAALEQHKRSAQWQNPRFIPSMLTWLAHEHWIQVLDEPEIPASRLTPGELANRYRK